MAFYMRSPVYTPNDPVKSVKQLHSWLYQLNENLKFMFSNLDSDNFTTEFSNCFSVDAARKTQEEIEKLTGEIEKLSEKTAWETLELSGFYVMNDQYAPAITNLGGHVYVTGEAQLLYPLSPSTSRPLTILKPQHTPSRMQEFFCRSDDKILRAIVRENGEFSILNTTDETLPANAAVSFSFSYGL